MALASPALAQVLSAAAGAEPVRLTADSVVFDAKRELYEARGNVVAVQGARTITADWLVFHKTTGNGVGSGEVVVTEGEDTLRARFLEFNVDTSMGVIFDGHLDSQASGFEMRGSEIVKTGDATYTFRDGVFTTCDCPDDEDRDPWQVSAGEADLEIGGYATARNASFDVLGVPVVWVPWMILPIKTERQTGFLLPDIGVSGRNGFELGQPFFWAVADPVNLTLTPRWLSDRGFKGDAQLETVFGRRSYGKLFGSVVLDDRIEPNTPATPFNATRYTVEGRQDIDLPGGIRAKADFVVVSDNAVPFDFDDLRDRRSARFLESTAFAGRTFGAAGRLAAHAQGLFADDLQNPNGRDRDDFLLQPVGTRARVLPSPLPFADFLVPSFDVDYTWFAQRSRDFPTCCQGTGGSTITRADGVFVDSGPDGQPNEIEGFFVSALDRHNDDFASGGPEGNGIFEEGELIADRGHRIDLWPRVAAPMRLADRVELYPEIGWRETLYDSDALGFAHRGMFTGLVDLRTRLRGSIGERVVHILEPRIGYAVVTEPGQSGNPLYVPGTAVPQRRVRQLAFENVLADRADRVNPFNGIRYGFGNRLFWRRPGRTSLLLGDVSLSNQYDFAADAFGPVFLNGQAQIPGLGFSSRFNLGFDPERANLSEALSELRFHHVDGHRLIARYRYLRDIPTFFEDFARDGDGDRFDNFVAVDSVSQGDVIARVALGKRWSATYNVAYSFDQKLLLGQRGTLEYFSRCECWGLGVSISDSRNRGVSFGVLYRVIGFGPGGSRTRGLEDSGSLDNLGLVDGF